MADDSDDEKFNSENVIRLITRLIFVWFLKQKGLIRNELFEPNNLSEILKDFDAESETQNNYYRAILQNLFFATLNQEIDKRGFAEDQGFVINRNNNAIKNLYRYEKEFQHNTTQVMELFSQVPFLNGGLFECLDRKEKDGRNYDWDGFSRNPKFQACLPNVLFFGKDNKVDLSGEYNSKKMKAVKVAGIIEILNRYNFTVEENTPVEVEVALDPELLGKVFENLLGAFNPETQETARKQTGSFYTPREIVNYMVDESMIAYFSNCLSKTPKGLDVCSNESIAEYTTPAGSNNTNNNDSTTIPPRSGEDKLRQLFAYHDNENPFDAVNTASLIQAAFDCKILDPACGSGAFPMGILQQMVHVLKKLDPDNSHWNNVVMTQAMKDFEKSDKLSDEDIEDLRKEIEKTFDDGLNHPDYARKLHVIENCIYGVDIQSIAVQISKLRLFISLVCEQGKNTDPTENFGIRPLPNLETKFVAANTLIGIEKNEEDMILFRQEKIQKLVEELKETRHRQFLVTNAKKKKDLREKDETLRHNIVTEVQKLYVKRADEDLFRLKIQLKQSEKELETLNKKQDKINDVEEQLTIFGAGEKQKVNITENRRAELRTLIAKLNRQITEGSNYTRLESVVNLASQLTSWNPYDQNDSSPFFDPEWMFGLPKQDEGYFDVVIGNPPYVQLQKMKAEALKLKLQNFESFESTGDLYCLFYEKGVRLLKFKGFETLITSSQWLKAGYGKSLRKFFLKHNPILLLELGPGVFESATVDSNILIIQKNNFLNELRGAVVESQTDINTTQTISLPDINENTWAILNPIKQVLNKKIQSKSIPLKDWKIDIYFGVKTGFNEAFIIDEAKRNMLIKEDSTNAEILKPILRGREIRTYHTQWDGGYLISTLPSLKIDIDNFPAVKNALTSYGRRLHQIGEEYIENGITVKTRKKTTNKWFETQDAIAFYEEFSKEKIIWKRIGSKLRFSYSNEEIFCLDSTCIATGEKLKYLTAFLNSKLCHYQLFEKAPKTGMGDLIISVQALEPLLVYYPDNKQENIFNDIVSQIIDLKSQGEETLLFEQQIDNLVYRLYELTYEEVKIIDPDIESKISEMDYNAIEV